MSGSWSGALLGLSLSVSTLLVISRLRATAPISLRDRIAPFVSQVGVTHGRVPASTLETLRALLPRVGPARKDSRQLRAASGLEKVAVIAAGVGGGAVLGFALALRGSPELLVILLAVLGGVAAHLCLATLRARAQRARADRIGAELPDLADLLAFAVAAGESPSAALARVGAMSSGELGSLIQRAAAETRLGTPFEIAMRDLVRSAACPDLERFIDALLLAMERGTPLADLLRAQAADSRAAVARRLMESAGRKDVAMLIPVVFLILPTVVLIALFPGFRSLHLFVH